MSAELPKMPPASAWRTRYRSEPGMIGHYPWTYTDSELRTRRVDQQNYEVEPLYTAAQLQEAARQAMERIEAMRHAGAMLSNCAFNLAQRNPGQFTARDIEALDSSRKAWDEALRALLPQSEKRHG